METALYHTFSTIPQVVAGAIILLAAFALYRLQLLNKKIDENIRMLIEIISIHKINWEIKEFNRQGQYDKILERVKKGVDEKVLGDNVILTPMSRLEMNLKNKKSIKKWICLLLILTTTLIIYSIIVLILTPHYYDSNVFCTVNFYIGLILLICCSLSYIIFIIRAFK